jgi:hypothetical protein
MDDRVKLLQLDTCISGCEMPIDRGLSSVALSFPYQHFVSQNFSAGDMATQTLAAEGAEFDLCHVQLAAVLGSEVQFQTIQNAAGFGWLEGLVQSSWVMGVQPMFHQNTSFSMGEMLMKQLIDASSIIRICALLGNLYMTPIQQRSKEHEQIGSSFSAIFVIIALSSTLFGRNALARLADQLNWGLVEANQRESGIFRALIHFQNIFHVVIKIGILFGWNTPLFFEPRFGLHDITDGGMRYFRNVLQSDHLAGQQTLAPAPISFRRLITC